MKLTTSAMAFTAALFTPTMVASIAHAHATLEKSQAPVNSYYKAVMRIPHGCDGHATLKVRITVPEGMVGTKPMPKAGWNLETVKGDYENTYTLHGRDITSGVKEIIWTGRLEDDHFDEFVFQTRLTDTLPTGETVYIPTVQECTEGQVAWIEIPAAGQDPHSLAHPAPGLMLLAAKGGHGHGHNHGHGQGHDHGAAHGDHAMEPVKVGDLEIVQPYARATPPNAPVSGGYMVIRNSGSEADRLIGGSVDFAGHVEIHEMKMDGDVMKMRELSDGLEIPAGGEVVLKPGGFHIMFMKMKEQLKSGETRTITLEFEKAGTVELELPVRDMKGGHGSHDHSGHGDHDMKGMGDKSDIEHLLKGMFETADSPLAVEPITIAGDWAVAGWAQDDRGGRGLLRKDSNGWYVHMCGGEGFRSAENLAKIGVPHHDAMSMAAEIQVAEAELGSDRIALFDSFDGVVEIGRNGSHDHSGHSSSN